jgi:hypothetical protein
MTTVLLGCGLLTAAVPAQAQSGIGDDTSPWGLRVGLASDPDQGVFGVNFLETQIGERLFIVPHADIGFGDDAVVIQGVAGVHYRFVVDAKVRPYAGGGIAVGWIDYDRPNNSDADFEIAGRGTGGIIWALSGGTEMFAEINLIFGDLYDAQVSVGWRF